MLNFLHDREIKNNPKGGNPLFHMEATYFFPDEKKNPEIFYYFRHC